MVIVSCGKGLRMAKPQDTVLTIDELADYLKLSKSTLRHQARRGDIPGVGHHGTGDLELTIRHSADLEKVKLLIQRSFEEN